jgi:hypothetical protein
MTERVYLGTVEGGANIIIIPPQTLTRANQIFDAERAQREALAAKARLQVMQAAKARGKLRRVMTACFGRARRGR